MNMKKMQLCINRGIILLLLLSIGASVYANSYYSKAVVKAVPSSAGNVYVKYNGPADKTCGKEATSGKIESENAPTTTYHFLAESTNPGYTWDGWYYVNPVRRMDDSKQGTVEGVYARMSDSFKAESKNSGSPTTWNYEAHWTPNSYDVTLAPNGGSGSNQTVSATYDSAMPSTLAAGGAIVRPSKTGYNFTGYYDSGSNIYYNADLSSANIWDKASTATLNAQWSAKTYKVTLNGNGGTGHTASVTATYNSNSLSSSITNPDKTGYTFNGWYSGEGGTGSLVINTSGVLQDNVASYTGGGGIWLKDATTTLYAQWTANDYRITLNNHEATTAGTSSVDVTFDATKGISSNIIVPAKTGYTFEGYYTEENGNGTQRINASGVWQSASGFIEDGKWKSASNVTLHAYWKQNQTITWTQDLNGNNYVRSTEITLGATAPGGTVTYTATSNAGTVQIVNTNKLTCLTAGSVTVTAHQSGNHDWNEAPDVSQTFTIIEHAITTNPTASGITYEQTLASSILSGGVTNVGGGSWSWDNNSIRPNYGTANQVAVFTPSSSPAFGASDTLHCLVPVTVAKATPDVTCTIGNEYYVDDTRLDLQGLWTREGDGVVTYSKVSFAPSGSNNEGATEPAITENRYLSLGQAGTLVIQMDIAEGTNYNARTGLTKTITINKRENTITNNKGSWEFDLEFNDELNSITFGSTNTSGPAITVNTDDEVTTYNAGEHKFSSNFRRGDGVWTIAQGEDYKYESANATLTLHVDVESCNCYAAKDATEYSMYWGNSTKDRYLTWSEIGVAGTVYYKAKRGGADSGARLSLYPKYGTADWETTALTTIHDSFKSSYSDSPLSYSLSDSTATGINFRLEGASTVNAHVKDMYVSRRRWINLQDAERNTITNIAMPINVMGGTQTATFYVNFSTCNEEIKLASTHPHITLSHDTLRIIPNANADGGSGRRAITITYTNDTPESISADIMVYTANEHAQIHVTAETEKHTQTITWGSAYSATTPTISVNKSITDAATASSSMQVLYRSSDESIIEIINEGQGFRAIAEGTATITAYQSGNDEYAEVESSKTFITSAKQIRHISWTQDFMRLTTESDPRPLTARVYIENPETGALTYNEAQSGMVTYTSSDEAVVSINPSTKYLSVVGAGTAVLTASIADDGSYSSASTTTPVRVRVPSVGCDDDPLPATPQGDAYMDGDEIVFFAFNTNPGVFYKIVTIDVTNGVPESVSFKIKGTSWGGTVYRGNLHLQQSEDGTNWVETEWDGEKPPTDNYKLIENISLNHTTRYLRFWRDGDAWGYHQIANITVNPAQYIESTLPKDGLGHDLLEFGDVRVGTTKDLTVRINYTNAKSDLQLAIANTTDFSIISGPDIEIADCGAKGYADVTVRCHPMNAGPLSTTMTVTDAVANKSLTINITASISRAPQVILWEPARTEFYTVETSAFQAALPLVTDKGVDVSLASSATDIVSFTGQTATIHKAGEVTITASQAGTPNYEAAVSVSKDFTINITPTEVITAPTIANAEAGTALGSLVIDASSAVVNNTITDAVVAGTFSVLSGEIGSVGTHTVTLLFTPTEGEKYTTCTCEVDVEILPKAITFNNGSGDSKWETVDNWSVAGVDENSAVTIAGHLVIDEEVAVYSLVISEEGTVTIDPEGGLTVGAGGIAGATAEKLILKAGTEGVTKGQTGYLRISPDYTGAMPEATVELLRQAYSNAYTQTNFSAFGTMNWQYVGCPLEHTGKKVKEVVGGWINSWNESTGQWVNNKSTLEIRPFAGFANSQSANAAGALTRFNGKLVDNKTKYDIPLTYTDASPMAGWNLLANSFAAPIDIKKMLDDNAGADIEQTIYLFNTGNTSDVSGESGTYTVVTKALAGTTVADVEYQGVIPAMQGFFVKANSNCNFRFNYTNAVWNATYAAGSENTPMRVNRRSDNSDKQVLSISMEANGQRDKVLLIEQEDYSTEFENGYDAHYMPVGGFNVFAVEGDDHLAVDATNSIIGTRVGVRTGEETAYTLVFSHVNSEEEMMLWDTEADEKVEIREGGMYTFFAEPNSEITGRFIIVEAEAPEIATGVEDVQGDAKVHKFIKDDKLFILKNGVLYDATGMRVR